MLQEEILTAQKSVRTDAYQMSIGEVVSMYEEGDLIVDPEFQRLFRWEVGQKSKLIESLLLGIPIPSIFVFEKDDGKWELIDGLQRSSTILEFMGKLRGPDGGLKPPSILEATRYLPSLHNAVWEKSDRIAGVTIDEQYNLDKVEQLAIRRARISVEILKRPSDDATKFELFQRLNAGGTQANAQELRNCIVLMVRPEYFRRIKAAAEADSFRSVIAISDDQEQKQRHLELAMRFLVHVFIPYDGLLDVEEYIDEGIIALASNNTSKEDVSVLSQTFSILDKALGQNALRRFDGHRHLGRVGLVALEGIAVGVGKNIDAIMQLAEPEKFVAEKATAFWLTEDAETFTSPGMRGTTRLQRTVPFGETWFQP